MMSELSQERGSGASAKEEVAHSGLVPQLAMMLRALWGAPARNALRLLATTVFLLIAVTAYGQIRLNHWNNPFYDALSQRDFAQFLLQLGVFASIAGALLVLNVAQQWPTKILKLKLREGLTQILSTIGCGRAGHSDSPTQDPWESTPINASMRAHAISQSFRRIWATVYWSTAGLDPARRLYGRAVGTVERLCVSYRRPGVWPWGVGRITRPRGAELLYIPRTPNLPPGTLGEVLANALKVESFRARGFTDSRYLLGFGRLVPMLEVSRRWDRALSDDEQQSLAFARVVLHAPPWVLIDAVLDSIDEDARERVLNTVAKDLKHTGIIHIGRAIRSSRASCISSKIRRYAGSPAKRHLPCVSNQRRGVPRRTDELHAGHTGRGAGAPHGLPRAELRMHSASPALTCARPPTVAFRPRLLCHPCSGSAHSAH